MVDSVGLSDPGRGLLAPQVLAPKVLAPQALAHRFAAMARRWVARARRALAGQALVEAEAEAQAANSRLRAALDALPEGVVFLDAEGRYVLWNEKYAEIYHRSADLFAPGARLIETLRVGVERGDYPDAIGRETEWLAEREATLKDPGARHEQRIADGRWLLIEERRTADGGVIGLRIDITDMKHQAEQLETALRRAEAANQAKSEFLANMSHEIRTPLNGVLGLAAVLRGTHLDPMQRDLLDSIRTAADGLNQSLGAILDVSRLEAGQVEIRPEPTDLAALVRETAAAFESRAQVKAIALRLELEPSPSLVMVDPSAVKQVLTHLLSNALKFTEAGQVTVGLKAAPDGVHTITVADTGIGFEVEAAERLFDRFEQADGSATRKFGGSGLGLAICRQLTQMMGGSIQALGEPGRGAVFTVALPLQAASTPTSEPAPADDDAPALKVLVADDNATNRKVVSLILQAAGIEVVCVEDGVEAVEAFEAQPYDAVLMDVQMPRMDGLTAIRVIRDQERIAQARRTPILVLSANAMTEHRNASAAAGADDHLAKPFRAEALIEAVFRAARPESEIYACAS